MSRAAHLSLPAFLLVLVVLVGGLTPAPARADETTPAGPRLELEYLDLLPLGEFERADFRAAHPELARTLEGHAGRIRNRMQKLAKLGDDAKEAKAALVAEIARLRAEAHAPLLQLREALRPHGLTDAVLGAMARAPRGDGRVERYSHQLVLLLEGLDADQRAMFERAVPEVDGAYLAAKAMRDRAELALKQSGLEERQIREILNGFTRQVRVIETRFWRLVDYALEDDQKAALWEMLPTAMRQHAGAQDHVYALPDLTPSQGTRVRALITEIEAESAPDQALVRRLQAQLRDRSLPREERQALSAEQKEAYARLNELKRFARDGLLEILTPAQVHAMKAIPPRVSINDRRRNGRQVFEGMEFSVAQEQAFEVLRTEGQRVARAYRQRLQELRRDGGDIGPDSPQAMMMEMMMAGARGDVQTSQRELLGRAFREILRPEQVSGWLAGLYGYRR